jgi:hypothetical protein
MYFTSMCIPKHRLSLIVCLQEFCRLVIERTNLSDTAGVNPTCVSLHRKLRLVGLER